MGIADLLLEFIEFDLNIKVTVFKISLELVCFFEGHFPLNEIHLFERLHLSYFVLLEETADSFIEESCLLL